MPGARGKPISQNGVSDVRQEAAGGQGAFNQVDQCTYWCSICLFGMGSSTVYGAERSQRTVCVEWIRICLNMNPVCRLYITLNDPHNWLLLFATFQKKINFIQPTKQTLCFYCVDKLQWFYECCCLQRDKCVYSEGVEEDTFNFARHPATSSEYKAPSACLFKLH